MHDDVSEYNDAPSLRSVGSAPIVEENYGLVPRSGNSISSSEYGQFGSPGQFNTHIDASSRAPENNSQFPPVAADGECNNSFDYFSFFIFFLTFVFVSKMVCCKQVHQVLNRAALLHNTTKRTLIDRHRLVGDHGKK